MNVTFTEETTVVSYELKYQERFEKKLALLESRRSHIREIAILTKILYGQLPTKIEYMRNAIKGKELIYNIFKSKVPAQTHVVYESEGKKIEYSFCHRGNLVLAILKVYGLGTKEFSFESLYISRWYTMEEKINQDYEAKVAITTRVREICEENEIS